MLKNLLGSTSDDKDSNDPNPYDQAENAMAAAASSFLKQATETIASNMEQHAPNFPQIGGYTTGVNPTTTSTAVVKKIAPFPLVDDDAGLLLANETKDDLNTTATTEEDDDALASKMLVQFPSYGTQSQALHKDSSSQWQEKTADWLLGGTSSIPTPKQQLQQKQQMEEEKKKQLEQQQQQNGMLPTVDEESNLPMELLDGTTNHPYHPSGSLKRGNPNAVQLVNSRDWSVDEQLLWKSPRFPPHTRTIDNASNNTANNNNNKHTYTTRNGEVLTLKEHDVVFQPPVLEDPSRDFLAAYYYHVGVQPKIVDRTPDREVGELAVPQTTSTDPSTLKTLIQQHSSPYHLNSDIRTDLASLGGLAALLDEEKESEEVVASSKTSNTSATPLKAGLLTDKNNTTGIDKKPSNNHAIDEVAWMPDRLCKTCYSCDTPFTVFRRRHHCRLCGQVFCNTCSGFFVPADKSSPHAVQPLAAMASPHKLYKAILPTDQQDANNAGAITLRTCKMCYEQVTSRQQEQQKKETAAANETAERKRKSGSTSTNEKEMAVSSTPKRNVGGSTSTSTTISTATTTPSVPKDTTTTAASTTKSAIASFEESSAFLRQWSKAIGAEGITSLATKTAGMVMDETQEAVAAAAAAVLPLSSVKQTQRQTSQTSLPTINSNASTTSAELQLAMANENRSMHVKEGNMHLGKTAASHLEQMTASLLESDAPLMWKSAIDNDEQIKATRKKWVHKLMSLATRCCATVDTNVKKGDMLDIRPYVKIKGKRKNDPCCSKIFIPFCCIPILTLASEFKIFKLYKIVIPGGSCYDCTYISGILFHKTGTNKQMPREIINPKIMVSVIKQWEKSIVWISRNRELTSLF